MLVVLAVSLLFLGLCLFGRKRSKGPNPFAKDYRTEPQPFVADKAKRDAVLKQRFTSDKVQGPYDAIVVGSGMGGLCCAALLSRAGKKVLVLEQHDQAGGTMHTFHEKGFEFDTGVHYLGQMGYNSIYKFLLDQISNGQIVWDAMDQTYDRAIIGDRSYDIRAGQEAFTETLKQHFPNDHAAIDKYNDLINKAALSVIGLMKVKFLSAWVSWLLVKTGLVHVMTPFFRLSTRTLQQVLDELTPNKELQGVLAYCLGDYGVVPRDVPFTMHALLVSHYRVGAYYPRGGASEFAFHIIPAIEASGGRVLVNARVTQILTDPTNSRAIGVRLDKDNIELTAPIIISDAGASNTYNVLLSDAARAAHPSIPKLMSQVKVGLSTFSLFVGLDGSKEALQLPATNLWYYPLGPDHNTTITNYMALPASEACDAVPPLLFVGFPSAKDSAAQQRAPGQSTCVIIGVANWDWVAAWKDERVMKRGADYTTLKDAFKQRMWAQALTILPQLEGRNVYMDMGTPVTNCTYMAVPQGEAYGLDHNLARFTPEVTLALRPDTCISNLYLTGQDIFVVGVTSAMVSGLLTASAVLGRNLFTDMMLAKRKFRRPADASKSPSKKDN